MYSPNCIRAIINHRAHFAIKLNYSSEAQGELYPLSPASRGAR